jgi:hypothetical protein
MPMLAGTTSANSSRCDGRTVKDSSHHLGLLLPAWVLPGSAHIMMGEQLRGWSILALINGLWIAGVLLSDFEAISRSFNPYLFWLSSGCGLTPIVEWTLSPAADNVLHGLTSVNTYKDVSRFNDTGVHMACFAGLLNLLAMLDIADRVIDPQRTEQSEDRASR